MLFDICNTFGVAKEDVMLLLDYGYSSDEIEDMLMDCDLLQSTIQNIKYQNYYNDFFMEI
ncbi:MAG: hypothetical protein K2I06_05165 [Ruminococcus sp.]|nr:hypothetical protein [Ruminococcus sp.]